MPWQAEDMGSRAVPWRQVAIGCVVAVLLAAATAFVFRSDGFSAVDATVPRSTRWFADQTTGRLVLIDGYAAKALARVEPDADTEVDRIVQGGGVATLLDLSAAAMRSIDGVSLKLGPSQPLDALRDPATVVGASQTGIVAIDPTRSTAYVVPTGDSPISVDIEADPDPATNQVAPDGAAWTLVGGVLRRTTATKRVVVADGLDRAAYSLAGNEALIADLSNRRVRFGQGDWIPIPEQVQTDEIVLQEPGPQAPCGWFGADGQLFCVGEDHIDRALDMADLDIDGGDLLAIAGDAGVVVDRSTGTFHRIDWRSGAVLESVPTEAGPETNLALSVSVDLVWVDSTEGDMVWAVSPWSIGAISKDDAATPLIGQDGQTVVSGGQGTGGESPAQDAQPNEEPVADENGIDDPPVAIDDTVTARSDTVVPIVVTANDYDPDGEAISLASVTTPAHGAVTIASATTVSYVPDGGFIGKDSFVYTVVDAAGNEATAEVTVTLLSPDAVNQAPVGTPDSAQTARGRAVVVDVLINDVDPERDALRIDTFTTDTSAGTVREVIAPSGLPGLRFEPAEGFSGTASFTYQPMDALGATGEAVDVTVDVAALDQPNRPPIAKPDAIRVRRGVPGQVAVLANDRDPDGDELGLALVQPVPESIDVSVNGDQLVVTALAGAPPLVALKYQLDDGRGGESIGSVLISVIDEQEPNRAPIANADTATVVAGSSTVVDVLLNDSDPDGDSLVLLSATSVGNAGAATLEGNKVRYTASAGTNSEARLDRFTYLVTDGNGHEAEGYVSVRVIPERLPEPPVALADSVSTEQNTPVVIDVLRNDSDPSGDQLSIVGTPGCPSGGRASVTARQMIRFEPPEDEPGVFRCNYEISNSRGLRASSSITISVVAPTTTNQPPIVNSEERTIDVGQSISVNLLANDSDPDGSAAGLRVVSSTEPVTGTATRSAGTITYQAPLTPTVVTIRYDVQDEEGAIASGRLTIRVVGTAKLAPVAAADYRTMDAKARSVSVDVLANDSDPDGSAADLVVRAASVLAGAASAEVRGRAVVVAVDEGFVGEIQVRYTIEDPDGLTDTALVVVTVEAEPNRPPVAISDVAQVIAGGTVSVPVALNDSDPDGDPLTFTLITGPPQGAGWASLSGSTLRYTAAVKGTGEVTLRYAVSDGNSTVEADVTIYVLACEAAAPVARDAFLETGYQQAISIDLNNFASNGSVVDVAGAINSAAATYLPPAGENGNVVITYAVENACGDRDTGTITIDVNQDPVARESNINLGRYETRTLDVSELASDHESLRIRSLDRAPTWVSIGADGRTVVIKPKGASGRADFDAIVTDPGGLTARVPVTVNVQNSAPVAVPDEIRVDANPFVFDLLQNDNDPDGDPIRVQSIPAEVTFTNGQVASISEAPGGYQIDFAGALGEAEFRYTISDSLGQISAEATARLVIALNPPVAADTPVSIAQLKWALVTPNASDPDGDPLTFTVDRTQIPPQLVVSVIDSQIYVAASGVPVGVYYVPYTATDPTGNQASANIVVEVTAP